MDFDLAKVMCDVSLIPSIITPLEESEVQPPSRAAEYAAPATPAFENVVESPGYTVPEDSGLAWIPGFVPVSETVQEGVSEGTASTSGSDVGRDTGCGSSNGRASCTDDAADSGR